MKSININKYLLRTSYLLCVLFIFAILTPVKAQITFNCYLCNAKSESKTESFCIQVPTGQSVTNSINTLKEKFENNFLITCDSNNLTDGKCSKLGTTPSSICANEPVTANKFDPKSILIITEQKSSVPNITGEAKATAPNLNVPIPGLDFSDTIDASGVSLLIPYLAQYISALQKYLIGIALILASIMIIVGGIKYIIASTGAKVERSKEIIIDAVMGLIIILSSYVILLSINPNTLNMHPLQITQVQRMAFSLDAPLVKSEVQKLSTPSNRIKMPIIELGGNTPIEYSAEKKDQPIQDGVGNYVIQQGQCPSGMIYIKQSTSYKTKTNTDVSSFCIDKYEAPNVPGVKPFIAVTEPEADLWCHERGKRLCTVDEWQRACLGPDGTNTYGYGPEYIEGQRKLTEQMKTVQTNNPPAPCNYDSAGKTFQTTQVNNDFQVLNSWAYFPKTPTESILHPDSTSLQNERIKKNYDILMAAIEKFPGHEPSGSRINCKTEEYVYDMTANVQEITLSKEGMRLTLDQRLELGKKGTSGTAKPYRWVGFYWRPYYHEAHGPNAKPTCTIMAGTSHAIAWRAHENGFRCCISAQD